MDINEYILSRLQEFSEEKNADFQAKLTPTITRESCLGVRVPNVKKLGKEIEKMPECEIFIKTLPHTYFDENMLHAAIISRIKDYDKCIESLEAFLPYVDNWAVCDTIRPAIFKKDHPSLIEYIRGWVASKETYTIRFGIGMLMAYFLDDKFKEEYLELPAAVVSEEYYVNMMIAWYYATALAKRWDETIPYIENNKLGKWTHNKTIQKAVESYRITSEQKDYLRTLRIKK